MHSASENATVIRDRHNLIYADGPIERFVSALGVLGFREGMPDEDFPHSHHYRQEFDIDAAAVMQAFAWRHTPLQPEDEQ
jgi:hypothetical protein